MRILSNFKDYYDFVAYQYGIDESVTYKRIRVSDKKIPVDELQYRVYIENDMREYVNSVSFLTDINFLSFPNYDKTHQYKWLIVCGKKYLLYKKYSFIDSTDYWKIFSPEAYQELLDFRLIRRGLNYCDYVGSTDNHIVELSKKIGHPIFLCSMEIEDHLKAWRIIIENKIPNLKELGLSKLIDPFTLYQDINYFLVNILNDSPDTQPPILATDKDKIVAHGFDIKQSFRKRK